MRTVAGMVRALPLVAVAVLVAACGSSSESQPELTQRTAPAGFEDVVARALPTVVQIRSERGLGSGIVYDRSGHVVTNAHVVAGAKTFEVTAHDGRTHKASLRGTFPEGDLAVVKVERLELEPATFGDSGKLRAGQYALAIGNPLGLRGSVTQGIVSSTSRTVSEGGGVALSSVIQTSAPINPGNSGGALVDADGNVIGIPTLAATVPEFNGAAAPGIGFAISSNTAREIARQLIASGRVTDSGRAALGVGLLTLPGGGVLVTSVKAGGAAAEAGFERGDVIERIGETGIGSVDDAALVLARLHPGERVRITVRRGGSERTLEATLGEAR